MKPSPISTLVRLCAPLTAGIATAAYRRRASAAYRRRASAAALVLAYALAGATAAHAENSLSQNWAGYAVHGTKFQAVSARWHQPIPTCTRGQTRYSAMWVGLGGYALSSTALEQIGTELDCNAKGRVVSSAWYELVPGPSHTVHLLVRPGDRMSASVSVAGQKVTVSLNNLSRNRSFSKTITTSPVDISSAEWILEAPSVCIDGTSSCRTLPLTNFRHAAFAVARAQPAGGVPGTIAGGSWVHTKITLGPSGPQFVSNRTGTVPVGTALPSSLINNGSSFTIAFKRKYVPSGTLFGPALRGRSHLQH